MDMLKHTLIVTFYTLIALYILALFVLPVALSNSCTKKNIDYLIPTRPLTCWLNKER